MLNPLLPLAMPLLRRMDAERAHRLALTALAWGAAGRAAPADPALETHALGLRFANPLGLAAGFDKDAQAATALLGLGFGHVELGTVTPRPQPGNPRPRLFRLAEDAAAINRYGFNSGGLDAMLARLAALPRPRAGIVGVNLGINKEGAEPLRDYPALYAAVAPHADYVAVNLSSPNTPGLRDLQAATSVRPLLDAIAAAPTPVRPPVLVKIAPDLDVAALPALVEACVEGNAAGLIVSNTTLARPPGLRSAARAEAGGLSGAPLFAPSTALLREVASLARGRLLLVGAGGVATGAQALAKLRAGATLVQLYTAFAYAGPPLVPRVLRELAAALRADGFVTVADAVGADLRDGACGAPAGRVA